MPTGYTAFIENGDITTGKDFLLLCSRAFGVAIEIRDEPLTVPTPTEFKPNDYYQRRYDEAVQRLAEGRKITVNEAREQMISAHNNRVNNAHTTIERMKKLNEKYAEIRGQVSSWIPPTDDHNGIKKFALEQIDMCVESDKSFQYYQNIIDEPFDNSNEAVCKYMEEYIRFLEEDVKRAKDSLDEEINRANGKTKFMQEFIDSLKNM